MSVDGGRRAGIHRCREARLLRRVQPAPGPRAFDAVDAVAGKTLPKKQVVQDRLFDANNVKDVLAKKDYWE